VRSRRYCHAGKQKFDQSDRKQERTFCAALFEGPIVGTFGLLLVAGSPSSLVSSRDN